MVFSVSYFQWVTGKFLAEISHATFSSDSQLVYAIFLDGTASVFNTPNFHLQCRIDFNACIPLDIRYFIISFDYSILAFLRLS